MQRTPNGFYMLMLPEQTLEIVSELSSRFGITYPEVISLALSELSKKILEEGDK